ncbi:zinc finger protein ZAT9-like [Solanum dulcamara]|uniref:zinc finger protein ZAT9-like n=1 Tax=Solanum dulcamara TaxID=45834 RepID=UPI0024854DD8|nr:zinc finger protein ZAT9-like [Solanum dulcamara]
MGYEDHEVVLKHVCKFCNKSFHCGRSLGGHMRSHMVNTTDGETSRKKLPALIISSTSNNVNLDMGNQSVNYGLRENPKKTSKFSQDLDTLLPKVCKECGKSFQSWKALFGHMKCHSSSQEEDSWNSASESDTEAAAARNKKKKKRSSRRRMMKRYMAPTTSSSLTVAANASPCVSEIEHEQEEIAMSLILLSRDVGNWVGHNHVTTDQCSDNNSHFLQSRLMSSSTKSELIKKVKNWKTEQGETSNKSPTNGQKRDKSEPPILGDEKKKKIKVDNEFVMSQMDSHPKENYDKIKFECTTCNKSFHSYQALGGHRASHKNTKGENCTSIDIKNCSNESGINEFRHNCGSKKQLKMHECPICYKIFPSGQALGGHKRSHLIAEAKKNINNNNQTVEVEKPIPEIRNFLDLNLPAPVEEEEDNILDSSTTEKHIEFQQWWIDSRHKHEQLLGLLSN